VSWQAAWPDGVGHRWLDALRIPALPWARPLVGALGLPPAIAERPEPLAAIAQAAAHRRGQLQRDVATLSPFAGLDGGMTRETAINAVHELADVYSREDAESFERWARLHIVEPDDVLWAWQLVLIRCLTQGDARDAPEPIRRENDFLTERLGPGAGDALQRRVRELAPEPTEEEVALGSDVPREAGVLQEAIERQRTLQCLRRLREAASEDELQAITSWAQRSAVALRLPGAMAAPERLAAALRGELEARPFESALELDIPQRPPSAATG